MLDHVADTHRAFLPQTSTYRHIILQIRFLKCNCLSHLSVYWVGMLHGSVSEVMLSSCAAMRIPSLAYMLLPIS
jgi:hypothetical protein